MKKRLAIMLVLVMIISVMCLGLSNCKVGNTVATTTAETTAAVTTTAETTAAATTTAETTAAKESSVKGSLKGKVVGISSPLNLEQLNQLYADIQEAARRTGSGLQFIISDAAGDPAKQAADGEFLLAQNVNLLFVIAISAAGWDVVIQKANEKGTIFMNWSSIPLKGATQSTTLWSARSGRMAAEPAGAWINEKLNGVAKFALLNVPTDPQMQSRVDAFKARLLEIAPNAQLVGQASIENDMEAAASATASLIQAHPDLNMIFAPFVSAALGAERAATEADKTDTDNFYIASVDGSVDMLKLIKQGSVLQSSSSTLFRYDAVIVEMDMERLLLGEKVPPFRLQIPKIVTKENVDELLAILDDPFNPKNEYIYSEITTYLDTPWEPGVALPDPDLPIKPVSLNPLSRFTE